MKPNQCTEDLSVIFLTLNRLPEHFANYQYQTLKEAVGDYPLLTVSRKPMDGWNILDDNEPGYLNIYRQLLRAAKLCDTPYVAVAEDDCLYSKDHFTFHRPALDTFAYNQHRFALFTWGVPMYHWRNRKSNATLIAPRLLLIEALEERFDKHGDTWPQEFIGELGRERVDRGLGVTIRKSEEVFAGTAVIQLNHEHAHEERQRRQRKSYGPIKAFDIPHWGRAEDLIKHYT
jgi:hypothetical protein